MYVCTCFKLKFFKIMYKENIEIEDDSLILDIPKEKRNLNTASYDYSVGYLVSLMQGENPKIILEVPFQRNYIWKDERASTLIESIIINVPIPPLYFSEEEDGRWLVIDGLQRLNSLKRFYANEFGLKKLEIIKEFSDPISKTYIELPPKAKSLLDDGLMRVIVIKKDSHKDIKFDIFMRLNKGAVSLNNQELRNCLYRGNLNNSVKKLVEDNKEFLAINGADKPDDRFEDVEFVLRYFAISENLSKNDKDEYFVNNFKGSLVKFLNDFMDNYANSDSSKVNELITKFNSAIEKAVKIFGIQHAFRDLTGNSTKINRAIADYILVGFEKYEIVILEKNKDLIISLFKRLITEDEKFKQAITQRTLSSFNLNYRINTWIKELNNVISI